MTPTAAKLGESESNRVRSLVKFSVGNATGDVSRVTTYKFNIKARKMCCVYKQEMRIDGSLRESSITLTEEVRDESYKYLLLKNVSFMYIKNNLLLSTLCKLSNLFDYLYIY